MAMDSRILGAHSPTGKIVTVPMCHGLNPVPGYVSMACLQNMADVKWHTVAHSGKAETSDSSRGTPRWLKRFGFHALPVVPLDATDFHH